MNLTEERAQVLINCCDESEEVECEEQGEGNLHCPLCNSVMTQMAGMVFCTNPMCPNNKRMAA